MELDRKSPVGSLLEARGVTVRELADKLRVSTQSIHYHVAQGDRVKLTTLHKLARACGARIVVRLAKSDRRRIEKAT